MRLGLQLSILALVAPSVARHITWSPAEISSLVGRLVKDSGIPGIAVGVVADGDIAYAEGFGKMAYTENDKPVNNQTLFQIGSCTKTFIAMGIAQYVDAGTIGWDTTVVSILGPGFTTNNSYLTENLNVGDLLAHRSGYGDHSGDMLWMVGDVGTEHDLVMKRLPFLAPTKRIGLEFMCTHAASRTCVGACSSLLSHVLRTSPLQPPQTRILATRSRPSCLRSSQASRGIRSCLACFGSRSE